MSVWWFSRGAFIFSLIASLIAAEGAGTPFAVGQSPPSPAVASPSAAAPAPASSIDIETLRHMEADYVRAEMEDNAAIAKTILAEDYVGLKSDGSTTGKADVLNNLQAGAVASSGQNRRPVSITAINMREHLFGDAACVTYTKIYSRGNTGTAFRENVLHLYTRRNGLWHLQMSTPTPVPH